MDSIVTSTIRLLTRNGKVGFIGSRRCVTLSASNRQQLRFDGQTAIVTGAGRGLGKEYALLLASRGANLVVNDYGGDKANKATDRADKSVAQQVADEILQKYPEVKVHIDSNSVSVEDGANKLVESTVDKFGRVDILINNAGILRDISFAKMTVDDWDQVQNVHLRGSFLMSRACWPQMRKQNYGKIIMTASTSGLFGNFGQANYSAAKMGLIGLGNTLSIEGRKNNICCNTIVPMAASRMTQDILPEELANKLSPAYVAPLVAYLCHSSCDESGALVEAAGGWYGRYSLVRTNGKYLPAICDGTGESSIEQIANNWAHISTFDEKASHVDSFGDHLNKLLGAFENK